MKNECLFQHNSFVDKMAHPISERSQMSMSVQFDTIAGLDQRKTKYASCLLADTLWQGRILLMDNEIQFAEADEHRYHEMLVHPLIATAPDRSLRVLILGGGDGLATREVLKWQDRIQSVTIVDYDQEFVSEVAKSYLSRISDGSLDDKRVQIVHENALTFARNTQDSFDVIIIDLPDPDDNGFAQLYIDLFFACQRCLAENGVLVTHTGPTSLNRKHPCWEFLRTLRQTAHHVYGNTSRVHFRTAHIPSFVHPWGFFYVTPQRIQHLSMFVNVSRQCRYIEPGRLEHTLHSNAEYIGDRDIRDLYESLVMTTR
jgi:spermidine synthase